MAVCKSVVSQANSWHANKYTVTDAKSNNACANILWLLFNAAAAKNNGGEIRFLPSTSITRY